MRDPLKRWRTTDPRNEVRAKAAEEARDEGRNADTKAGILLALATAGLAGLVAAATGAPHITPAASISMWLTAAVDGSAVAVLLAAIRSRVPRKADTFADHRQLLDEADIDLDAWHRGRLELFSRLAVRKHRLIKRAVDLLRIALACFALAAVLLLAGL